MYVRDLPLPRKSNHRNIDFRFQHDILNAPNHIVDTMLTIWEVVPTTPFILINIQGVGKTTTIFALAQRRFLIYVDCRPGGDATFRSMLLEMNSIVSPYPIDVKYHSKIWDMFAARVRLELCARLNYLLNFLAASEATPSSFLDSQLTQEGQTVLRNIVEILKKETDAYLQCLITDVIIAIRQQIRLHPIIAFDEAGFDVVISRHASLQWEKEGRKLTDESGRPAKELRGGLLSVLVNVARNCELPFITAGNYLPRQLDQEYFYDKSHHLVPKVIVSFVPLTKEQVVADLENNFKLNVSSTLRRRYCQTVATPHA